MSGPFGSSQWMYSSGGFYDFPIEQSLKFNDDDSSYLSWTPASAGDQRTWTFSTWVKRGQLGVERAIFSVGATSPEFALFFHTTDQIRIWADPANTGFYTNAVYRDTSAWYHIVLQSSNVSPYLRLYVNGDEVTSFSYDNRSSNNTGINSTSIHRLGAWYNGSLQYWDGYLAEVNFIDGQALDASSFGDFKSGVWIPKDPSNLSYGTNGFRLSFQNDTVSEGFNTVTFSSDGSSGSVSGLGFSPDFVWAKSRTNADGHELWDTVRGTSSTLFSNVTEAQDTSTGRIVSFDADGFSYGTNGNMQTAGNFVAWCWDAGSGSPVSNTDGSITSTVKANAAYGMSIITWTGNGSGGSTIGHGLGSAPEMVIVKNRSDVENWAVYHASVGNTGALTLNATDATLTSSAYWNNTSPTSSVITLGGDNSTNGSGNSMVAYAFHSVAGYSKVSSYSGSGSAGNAVTTGFKPAFVMIKRTDSAAEWVIADATRNTSGNRNKQLYPNTSGAEYVDDWVTFNDTGFTMTSGYGYNNASGGTYIYIAFADTRDNAFWRDQSGNGNDWQPNNLTYQDSLPDSTTNNFAVLNVLAGTSTSVANFGWQAKEGNLLFNAYEVNTYSQSVSCTIPMQTGKWYFEFNQVGNTIGGNPYYGFIYTDYLDAIIVNGWQFADVNASAFRADGNLVPFGSTSAVSFGSASSTGDIIQLAVDADSGKIWWGLNGTWFASGDPASGTNEADTFTGSIVPVLSSYSAAADIVANFGQDSSFAGNKPAQGNTDDNGIGDFYYAPPSGYLALCSENLPNPTIDPAQDDVPSDYFNTVLYTGNGSTQSVTVGWQPDWVWVKARSAATGHRLFDVVRGDYNFLESNSTAAEGNNTNQISLDADGFSTGSSVNTNDSGDTYVAWNWKAGNGTSSNTSGSITSTVSANQKAGFSVVSYTGTGATATFGHGINSAPSMVIIKDRDNGTKNWTCYHKSMGNDRSIFLNLTNAQTASTDHWQYTNPSSSVVYIGDYSHINTSGNNYIAYCFAEVEGYSKFGSYTGNGSTDGPFVYTGHVPAFLIIKRTDSADDWTVYDNTRSPYNQRDELIYANSSNAETANDTGHAVDFLSNGFKCRGTSAQENANGGSYIFMSFASNPFKFSTAR